MKDRREYKMSVLGTHHGDRLLSSDSHYVATLTSLLQHLSFSSSHIMSRQSCEMSRQC